MPDFAAPLQRLIDEFRRLPGVGQKSAQRLAFHVLRSARDDAARLATALLDVKDNLGVCAECNNISDSELCPYCGDPNRDRTAAQSAPQLRGQAANRPPWRTGPAFLKSPNPPWAGRCLKESVPLQSKPYAKTGLIFNVLPQLNGYGGVKMNRKSAQTAVYVKISNGPWASQPANGYDGPVIRIVAILTKARRI